MIPADQLVREITRVLVDRLELQLRESELSPDARLMDDLGLDSAGILELVVGVEEKFSIDFDVAGTTEDDFHSIRSLARYVETRL
jgi:acyl carrier protein